MANGHVLVAFVGDKYAQKIFRKLKDLPGIVLEDPLQIESPPEDTNLDRLWNPFKANTYRALKRSRTTHVCMQRGDTILIACIQEILRELSHKEKIEIKIIKV